MRTFGSLAIVSVLTLGLPAAGCRDSTGGVEPAAGNALSLRASSSAAADLPAPDPRPVLACFGDSLTAGYGTEPGESYPDFLQRRLDAAGFHYRVVNLGISGDTTKDGLDRIARVLSRHPNIVVLEFGGNDGLRGLPLEQTQANLAAMIERLQAAGAQVALAGITLPPDYGKDYITRLDAIYPTLARRYHLRLLPFLLQGVYGVPGDMQSDATHATAQGNQQVALNVQRLIEPLLRHESRPPRP